MWDIFYIQLLWAQLLEDGGTAIVIKYGDQLFGGVADIIEINYELLLSNRILETNMRHRWRWYKVVNSVNEFKDNKEWEQKKIESPSIDNEKG